MRNSRTKKSLKSRLSAFKTLVYKAPSAAMHGIASSVFPIEKKCKHELGAEVGVGPEVEQEKSTLSIHPTSSSGYPGVSWNRRMEAWLAFFYEGAKRRSRTFSPKRMGGDVEKARVAAIEFMRSVEGRKRHPKGTRLAYKAPVPDDNCASSPSDLDSMHFVSKINANPPTTTRTQNMGRGPGFEKHHLEASSGFEEYDNDYSCQSERLTSSEVDLMTNDHSLLPSNIPDLGSSWSQSSGSWDIDSGHRTYTENTAVVDQSDETMPIISASANGLTEAPLLSSRCSSFWMQSAAGDLDTTNIFGRPEETERHSNLKLLPRTSTPEYISLSPTSLSFEVVGSSPQPVGFQLRTEDSAECKAYLNLARLDSNFENSFLINNSKGVTTITENLLAKSIVGDSDRGSECNRAIESLTSSMDATMQAWLRTPPSCDDPATITSPDLAHEREMVHKQME